MNKEEALEFIEETCDKEIVWDCTNCNKFTKQLLEESGYRCQECKIVNPIIIYEITYKCPDDKALWKTWWTCPCNDRCPSCDDEIEALSYKELYSTGATENENIAA